MLKKVLMKRPDKEIPIKSPMKKELCTPAFPKPIPAKVDARCIWLLEGGRWYKTRIKNHLIHWNTSKY